MDSKYTKLTNKNNIINKISIINTIFTISFLIVLVSYIIYIKINNTENKNYNDIFTNTSNICKYNNIYKFNRELNWTIHNIDNIYYINGSLYNNKCETGDIILNKNNTISLIKELMSEIENDTNVIMTYTDNKYDSNIMFNVEKNINIDNDNNKFIIDLDTCYCCENTTKIYFKIIKKLNDVLRFIFNNC